jgi:hypothetical protein
MYVVPLDSLVLRGVRIACDVVTGLERNGSMQADGQTPTMLLSQERHLRADYPQGTDPGRPGSVGFTGAASAALRAGRPGCSLGVPNRRGPAIFAGRAILSGWSPSVRSACANCKRSKAITTFAPAVPGRLLSGRPWALSRGPMQRSRQEHTPAWQLPGKRRARTLLASTRGK